MMLERLKRSRLLAFNLVNRDAWVAEQARLLPPGTKVLDVGAGSCAYRGLFSHCEYKTQDFQQLHGNQLRDGGYGEIDYVCDAAQIPVPDGSFGAIVCTEVLEHVPEPVKVIAEFSRILKSGGRIILSAPLASGIHQEPHHYYGGYTPYWYGKFLPEQGFSNITIVANAGFFKFFSQESLRFLQFSRPFRLRMPVLVELLWLPVWVLLVPFLGLFIPLVCDYLDRFDVEKRFTVGYHVTAEKIR